MSWLVSDPASPLVLLFVGRAGSETSHAATPPGMREARARATDTHSVAKSVALPPAKLLLDAPFPQGVARERAERELYERKVAVFERMLAEGTTDSGVATQLAEAAHVWPS